MTIRGKLKRIRRGTQALSFAGAQEKREDERFFFEPQNFPGEGGGVFVCQHPSVSVLILSRNRGDLLKNLLDTFLRWEQCDSVEFLVSLQDSNDDSEQILGDFSEVVPMRIFRPMENMSFSRGTNFLATQSSGDLLLLLNNDFSFIEPVICSAANVLSDPTCGAVSIPLSNRDGVVNQFGINFQFDLSRAGIRPVNLCKPEQISGVTTVMPAVTGAFLLTSKSDFFRIGTLDENYNYGLEDVDYCLRLLRNLGKCSVLLTQLEGNHPDQTTRKMVDAHHRREQRNRNFEIFQEKHGHFIRHALRGSHTPFLNPRKRKILLLAQDFRRNRRFGDSIVASFLQRRLQQLGATVEIQEWRKATRRRSAGFDYCVYLVHKSLSNLNDHAAMATVGLAWVRQWGARWSRDLMFQRLNWVGFAGREFESSLHAIGFSSRTDFCPLGADPSIHPRYSAKRDRDIDFLWPGNSFGVRREVQDLRPIPGLSGLAIGTGWKRSMLPAFTLRNSVAPEDLYKFYRRAKVVVDESGANTGLEGSLNMRFWEALAGGALPLSNNWRGVKELFGAEVPVWGDSVELEKQIKFWSTREKERQDMISKMLLAADPGNGLESAARKIWNVVNSLERHTRICILNPASSKQESHWGDTFLANEFGSLLQQHEFATRVLPREHWNSLGRLEAEVVITIHGKEKLAVFVGQLNVLWVVSNPHTLDGKYLSQFDEVWVASSESRSIIRDRFGVQAAIVLPAAAPVFEQKLGQRGFHDRSAIPLMIGNSTGRHRATIQGLVAEGQPLEVIGEGWKGLVPSRALLATSISRIDASAEYANRRVVLSDTRLPMREWRIFPPRIYEAIRAGAVPISDAVNQGVPDGLPVPQWSSQKELLSLVVAYTTTSGDWETKAAELQIKGGDSLRLETSAQLAAQRVRALQSLKI